MKKILLRIVIVFLVMVVVISSGLYFFVRNFDIKKFKPQIVDQIQNSLGRRVSLGDLAISFSVTNGLVAEIGDLKILDDPSFSDKNFFEVSTVRVGIDLIPALSKRQIIVSKIELIDPSISIIKNSEGEFNFQTFKFLNSPDNASVSYSAFSVSGLIGPSIAEAADQDLNLPEISVKRAVIENGHFEFIDHTDSALPLNVSKISLTVNNFSLKDAFNFALEAALFSDDKNVDIKGTVKIDLGQPVAYLRDTKLTLNLATIDIMKFTRLVPHLKEAGIQENIQGEFLCDIDLMEISPEKMTVVYLKSGLKNGEVASNRLNVPLKDISISIEVKDDTATISQMVADLAGASITAKGAISEYKTTQGYDMSLEISDLNLSEAINQESQQIRLAGLLSMSAEIKGQGVSSLLSFRPQFGKQTISLKEGKLENINILRIVLDKLNIVPDLVQKLEENLPEKYKQKLEQQDTPLTSVDLSSYVENSNIYIKKINAETDVFRLTGKGTVDFDLNANINAQLILPEDLSKSMIDTVSELRYLTDEKNEIAIPVLITGKIPDQLSYFPDLEYIGKKFLRNKGKSELRKVFGKVLNIQDNPQSSSEDLENQSGENNPTSPEDQLIGSVLNAIFK